MPDFGQVLTDGLATLGGNLAQTASNYLTNPMTIPSLITAKQQWDQAGNYQKDAEKYAAQLDPFGSQRGMYQGKLADIWNDPQAFLDAPAYQQLRKDNVAAAMSRAGAEGFNNSGRMAQEGMAYLQGKDWEQISKMRDQLAHNAGADIGPGAAAAILSEGMKGKYASQNAALAALGRPFNSNGSSFNQGGNPTSGPGSVQQKVQDWIKQGLSPQVAGTFMQNLQKLAAQVGPSGIPGGIQALYKLAMQYSGIDPSSSTAQILMASGIDPQSGFNLTTPGDSTYTPGYTGLVSEGGGGYYDQQGVYHQGDVMQGGGIGYNDPGGGYTPDIVPGDPGYYDDPNSLYPGGYYDTSIAPDPGFTGGYDDGMDLFGGGGGYTEAITNFFDN